MTGSQGQSEPATASAAGASRASGSGPAPILTHHRLSSRSRQNDGSVPPTVEFGGTAPPPAPGTHLGDHPTAGTGHHPGPRVPAIARQSGHSGAAMGAASSVSSSGSGLVLPGRCLNPAAEINSKLDSHVEVKVYPCNNNASSLNSKKKFTQFTIKPEGVIIQGANSRHRSSQAGHSDLGTDYARHIGRKLRRYELSDTRACQLLVTTHGGSYWSVPAPEAFSRHSGTCRLLGDRKHPLAPHVLQVGDFLRVGSVGVVVIETHDGTQNRILSEEKIKKIIKDTTSGSGGFLDFGETDEEASDDSDVEGGAERGASSGGIMSDSPACYMCFDDENTDDNPLITPCKCKGDTRFVHVNCLRKWHTAEADNQICFLSSVDATCSVCKTTFKSDFKLKNGRTMKLFKSSLEPPYVSLLVATKHEMAQRLFNTRFQLSFSTLLKPDGKNGSRPLLLGRSSGSDMVLDYRTVSARHASVKFKNGEFIFTDAGSSNGSYLYLRRPVELTPSQPVQFRLGRSMISMKVVNKWNRRLLRAVRRGGSTTNSSHDDMEEQSVGSNESDVRIVSDEAGSLSRTVPKRTRESIMASMPPPGTLSQGSAKHLDLLYALAYPKRDGMKEKLTGIKPGGSSDHGESPVSNMPGLLSSLDSGSGPATPGPESDTDGGGSAAVTSLEEDPGDAVEELVAVAVASAEEAAAEMPAPVKGEDEGSASSDGGSPKSSSADDACAAVDPDGGAKRADKDGTDEWGIAPSAEDEDAAGLVGPMKALAVDADDQL